jgi:cytochrome o ubiquinol oxidase subunit 2
VAKKSLLNKKQRRIYSAVVIVWFLALLSWYLHDKNFALLNPGGLIASKEKRLMAITVALGLIVIIPVYVMTFLIAWRYREGNNNARYSPELSGSVLAETVWWGIPTAIILALSVITWQTSHSLDPHRTLVSNQKPLTIQVIALDWKWLFIYPEQHVASLNYVELPVGRPVTFDITADAPMNSFWIPQLGGQIYAMPGMATKLNLVADKAGSYEGSSANLSGEGFSGMHFAAQAEPQKDFDNWVQLTKNSPDSLTMDLYKQLAKPSENNHVTQYSDVAPNLFRAVILKYMSPEGS